MKGFRYYLKMNEKSYDFRIKVANIVTDELLNTLEFILEKYDLQSLSKPKKTPIQEHPMDFRNISNAEIYIMDAKMSYPVTAHELHNYIVGRTSIPESHLVVISKEHPEEIAREKKNEEFYKPYSAVLEDPDYNEVDDAKWEDYYGDKYNEKMLKELGK